MSRIPKSLLFILLPVVLAIIGGFVWGLVDWLRSYGSGVVPFPYFERPVSPHELQTKYSNDYIFHLIECGINWYNVTFVGGTRFGSGLGWMIGAFIAMGYFKERSLTARTLAGVVAGAEIGLRFALNLGSGVPLFLVGLSLGAVIGGLYMGLATTPSNIDGLPLKELSKVE